MKGFFLAKSLKISSAISAFANIIQFGLGLILTPFIIKHLGDEYFGLWVFLNVFLSLEGMMLLGTTQSLNRFLPMYLGKKQFSELSNFLYSHFFLYGFLGVAFSGVLILAQSWIINIFNIPENMIADFRFAYPYLLGALALNFISQIFSAVIRSSESYIEYNIVAIATNLLRFVIIIIFISSGFQSLVYAIFFSTCLKLILFIMTSKFTWKAKLESLNPELFKKAIKLSFVFGTGSILMYTSDLLRHQIDSFLILKYLNLSALTEYKIGTTLLTSINVINISLFSVMLTRFSYNVGEQNQKEMKELLKKSFFVSSTLGTFFVLGLVATAENFLHLWLPSFTQNSLNIIYLLAIPQLIMIIQYPSINLMYAINKHHLLSYITFIEAVLNFIISFILISQIGVVGVIIGTGVGYIISKSIVMPIILKKYIELSYFDQIKMTLPNIMIGAIVYGLYLLIFENATTTLIEFIIKVVFIIVSYGMVYNLVYLLIPSKYSELFMLRSWIRRKY